MAKSYSLLSISGHSALLGGGLQFAPCVWAEVRWMTVKVSGRSLWRLALVARPTRRPRYLRLGRYRRGDVALAILAPDIPCAARRRKHSYMIVCAWLLQRFGRMPLLGLCDAVSCERDSQEGPAAGRLLLDGYARFYWAGQYVRQTTWLVGWGRANIPLSADAAGTRLVMETWLITVIYSHILLRFGHIVALVVGKNIMLSVCPP
jgi:hypothetical protein